MTDPDLEPIDRHVRAHFRKACQLLPGVRVFIPADTSRDPDKNLRYTTPGTVSTVVNPDGDIEHVRLTFVNVVGSVTVPDGFLFELVS